MGFGRVCLLFALLCIAGPLTANGQSAPPSCPSWQSIAMDKEHWLGAYDGFGKIGMQNGVHLAPRSIASESGTHAALALLKNPIDQKDFQVKVRYHNVKAFRTPQANTWEVFWLFFNYKSQAASNKTTNYFIFKPNGVEIGKAWGSDDQEFLATANKPHLVFGREYELILERHPSRVAAFINGQKVLEFNNLKTSQLYENQGQIGLYSEDSEVQVSSFEFCPLSS